MADVVHMDMELDSSTLALVNPSTQEETVDASPRKLLQPSTSALSPSGTNQLHKLKDSTPRGTHVASAEYKTAAATPTGEDAEAREKRLAVERARRYRARARVQKDLDKQVAAEKAALVAEAAAAMKQARRRRKPIMWEDMAPSCRAAATQFGFMRGMWNRRDSEWELIGPLIREEWFWPWKELPHDLKLAADRLGYAEQSWQTEQFGGPGDMATERCEDMEEVEMYLHTYAVEVEIVCSDSELIPGHDTANGSGENRFMHMDTMDLLPQPSRRSYCQGPFAAYRPRGWKDICSYCHDWSSL